MTRIASRLAVAAALWAALSPFHLLSQQADWTAVGRTLGSAGTDQPGGVRRFSFPRSDLQVTVDGVQLRPALALGSWIAFRRTAAGTIAMGDLVLAEAEVAPVISRLMQGGVQVSAVHNHLLRDHPRITYVHVEAHGDPQRIAETVHAALALTRTPAPAASPAAAPPPFALDTAALAAALGRAGHVNGGVWQVSVPRRDPIVLHGDTVPPSMGVATALNLQPTTGGRAVGTGDFVMTAGEVAPVLAALHEHGIEVTALHSHMVGEEPRLYFAHFWANGDAMEVARGLRAALERMAVR